MDENFLYMEQGLSQVGILWHVTLFDFMFIIINGYARVY